MDRRRRFTASMAGWLFADLALVLFVVSLASADSGTGCTSEVTSESRPEWCPPLDGVESTASTSTSTSTTTTSTTIAVDPNGPTGVKPDPVKFTLGSWSAANLAEQVEQRLYEEYIGDEALRSLGTFESLRFGVIIIYGGALEFDVDVGEAAAKKAEGILEGAWDRVNSLTYFETGGDQGLRRGALTLKLFPIVGQGSP